MFDLPDPPLDFTSPKATAAASQYLAKGSPRAPGGTRHRPKAALTYAEEKPLGFLLCQAHMSRIISCFFCFLAGGVRNENRAGGQQRKSSKKGRGSMLTSLQTGGGEK